MSFASCRYTAQGELQCPIEQSIKAAATIPSKRAPTNLAYAPMLAEHFETPLPAGPETDRLSTRNLETSRLAAGERLISNNRVFKAVLTAGTDGMHPAGILMVLDSRSNVLWSTSSTFNRSEHPPPYELGLLPTGELVLTGQRGTNTGSGAEKRRLAYFKTPALNAEDNADIGPYQLVLDNSGFLSIIGASGKKVWTIRHNNVGIL
jgi:hypothetical protein